MELIPLNVWQFRELWMVDYRWDFCLSRMMLRAWPDVSGCWSEGISSCDLRSYLEMARPSQERAEASQVLPVRFRPESRLCLCKSLPLREGRQPRHRPDRSLYTGQWRKWLWGVTRWLHARIARLQNGGKTKFPLQVFATHSATGGVICQ